MINKVECYNSTLPGGVVDSLEVKDPLGWWVGFGRELPSPTL